MNDQPPNKKRKITLDKISLPQLKNILILIISNIWYFINVVMVLKSYFSCKFNI